VHARIATLEAQGFPTPDMQSLTVTPFDVVEARVEALSHATERVSVKGHR